MAYWPSHAGKLVPLEAMAEPHLVAAMAKLRAQETLLVRFLVVLRFRNQNITGNANRKSNHQTGNIAKF